MADIQAFSALHYNLQKIARLDDVISPPYDVLDSEQRAALIKQSPYNSVGVDLPEPNGDPYAHAAELFSQWKREGALVRDSEDALWVLEQRYVGPDGNSAVRRGFFARVLIEEYGAGRIRPHERTHSGPKEDRLQLMRATKANLSPIFSLYDDPDKTARDALAPHLEKPPWAEFASSEGLAGQNTINSLWRVTDRETVAAVQGTLAKSELLIADGHHRYETARTYAREIGGSGPHNYVLMNLVALQDPGLTVFPTHRLIFNLSESNFARLRATIEEDWDASDVEIEMLEHTLESSSPRSHQPGELTSGATDENSTPQESAEIQLGYLDTTGRSQVLSLRNHDLLEQALADKPKPYQQLDTAVLETLLLKHALGMTDEDIDHHRGLDYARSTDEAIERVQNKKADVAFFLRPTPVSQIRAVAETGENMPPKTTYFFPKIPTGVVFNALE